MLILAMLFIGIAMVSSLSDYHRLVAIHKPLGILILVLAAIRLINRLFQPPPPLPNDMPGLLALVPPMRSHYVLYTLMFALPLVGWAMLSAAACNPIVLDRRVAFAPNRATQRRALCLPAAHCIPYWPSLFLRPSWPIWAPR